VPPVTHTMQHETIRWWWIMNGKAWGRKHNTSPEFRRKVLFFWWRRWKPRRDLWNNNVLPALKAYID